MLLKSVIALVQELGCIRVNIYWFHETFLPQKVIIGQRNYISKIDIDQMNLLYKCSGTGGGGGSGEQNIKLLN
jgi:hypothetical protein